MFELLNEIHKSSSNSVPERGPNILFDPLSLGDYGAKVTFDTDLLDFTFQKVRTHLFDKSRIVFLDFGGKQPEKNNDVTFSQIESQGSVYCIWAGTKDEMKPVYVGYHVQGKRSIKMALGLFGYKGKAYPATLIRSYLKDTWKLGISHVRVEPEYMTEPTAARINDFGRWKVK